MKIVFSLVVAVLLAAVAGLVSVDAAKAQCYAAPCGAYLVPPPNPIPLRRLKVVPAPVAVAGTCGPGCINVVNAYAAPPPCGQGGCGGTAFLLFPDPSLRLLEAAGIHRMLSRDGQLLLAQGLLVRFVRTPLLQLVHCD